MLRCTSTNRKQEEDQRSPGCSRKWSQAGEGKKQLSRALRTTSDSASGAMAFRRVQRTLFALSFLVIGSEAIVFVRSSSEKRSDRQLQDNVFYREGSMEDVLEYFRDESTGPVKKQHQPKKALPSKEPKFVVPPPSPEMETKSPTSKLAGKLKDRTEKAKKKKDKVPVSKNGKCKGSTKSPAPPTLPPIEKSKKGEGKDKSKNNKRPKDFKGGKGKGRGSSTVPTSSPAPTMTASPTATVSSYPTLLDSSKKGRKKDKSKTGKGKGSAMLTTSPSPTHAAKIGKKHKSKKGKGTDSLIPTTSPAPTAVGTGSSSPYPTSLSKDGKGKSKSKEGKGVKTTYPTHLPADMPTETPTGTRSPAATPEPTSIEPPVPAPTTETPVPAAPTTEGFPVSGEVRIALRSVTELMPTEVIAAYEQGSLEFFNDSFADADPPIVVTVTELTSQDLLDSPRTLRQLQGTDLFPLETVMFVSGISTQEMGPLNEILAASINADPTGFLEKFKNTGDFAVDFYFRPVEEVIASDPDVQPPTPPPVTSPPDTPAPTPPAPVDTPAPTPISTLPPRPPVVQPTTVSPTPEVTPEPTPAETGTLPPAPTQQPVAPPSSGVGVPATPFSVEYGIDGGDPSQEEFDAAADVTIAFLENVFTEQFNAIPGTDLEAFVGLSVGNSLAPVVIQYTVDLVFADTSDFIPTTAEIDVLIETAFTAPFVQFLLDDLQALPSSNPFSTTTFVQYLVTPMQSADRSKAGFQGFRPGKDIFSGGSMGGARNEPRPAPVTARAPAEGKGAVILEPEPREEDVGVQETPDRSPTEGVSSDPLGPVTSVEERSAKLTPFTLTFTTDGGTPANEQTLEAVDIILAFLDDFVKSNLAQTLRTTKMESLIGSAELVSENPPEIEFATVIIFEDYNPFHYPHEALDPVIMLAFQGAQVDVLMNMLRNLPLDNPFSNTSSIIFGNSETEEPKEDSNYLSSGAIIGIIAVCTVVAILGGLVMLQAYRNHSRKRCYRISRVPPQMKPIDEDLCEDTSSAGSHPSFRPDGRVPASDPEDDEVTIEFHPARSLIKEPEGEDPLFQAPFSESGSDDIVEDEDEEEQIMQKRLVGEADFVSQFRLRPENVK